MRDRIALRPSGRLYEPRNGGAGMTSCRIAGIAVSVLILGILLSQVPDLIRFTRMSSM